MLDNHWTILGAGSIGSLFACMFQQAGIDSTLLVRPPKSPPTTPSTEQTASPKEQSQRSGKKNINVTFLDGTIQAFSLNTQTTHCQQPPIRQLLLTTKAHQSQQAIASIQSRLPQGAIIVVMQNGMGVIEQLQSQIPHCHIIAATTTEGANRPSENTIIHAGAGETWIGSLTSAEATRAIAQELAQQWATLNVAVRYDENIKQRLWTKLAINCAINPLTVKYQCSNGELLNNPHALTLMESACEELQCIMTAQNITHEGNLFDIAKRVAEDTKNNISSMLQDYRHGRPTEIHYINGYVVNIGNRLGVPTPTNKILVTTVEETTFK